MGRCRPALLAALALACLFAATPALAQNILIFRPAENNATEVETRDIEFEVHVSAFAPIDSVTINGLGVPTPRQTLVVIKRPYRLVPGENTFVVEASNENGKVSKEFVIRLKRAGEEEPEKPPFQLIALLGSQSNTNANSAPADGTPLKGTRRFLVVIPRYDWFLGKNSAMRLQSIISRDSYGDDALAAEEVGFTQLSLAWIVGDPKEAEWSVGLGYNYIDQGYDGLGGTTHVEDDVFLFGSLLSAYSDTGSWNVGLEYKSQDLADVPADPDQNADATVVTLRVGAAEQFFSVRTKGQIAYVNNDAVGKLQDQRIIRGNVELAYPLGPFIPAIGARYRHTVYNEVDPDQGVALDETLSTSVANLSWLITQGWVLLIEYVDEKQSANVSSEAYSNKGTSVTLVLVF